MSVRPLKVCFVGDSIVRGVDAGISTSSTGGFRSMLWDSLKADYVVDLVGTVTDSLPWFPDEHEGWNGLGIGGTGGGPNPQLTDKVSNLTTVEADIVCVMAGTNDILQGWTTAPIRASMATRMGELLDAIHAERPDALVLLGSMIVLSTGDSGLQSDRTTFNAALPGLASARSSWCTFVDTASGLTSPDDLSDTVHPNAAGHAKLAANWLPALETAIASFTATSLVDGNDLTFRGGGTGLAGYTAYLSAVAAKLSRTVPPLTNVNEASPLAASIERGQWVVQHPDGGGCEAVFLDRLLTLSTITWSGNQWRPVSMPDTETRSEIERLLGHRTADQRWWTTESIATLQAENASLGLPT